MRRWIVPSFIIIAAFLTGLISYPYLPEQLPTHWNASGMPDEYRSKTFAIWLMPALMILLFLSFQIIRVIDPKRKNIVKFSKDIDMINNSLLFVFLIIHGTTILYGLGWDINMSMVMPVIIGIVFVVIGNYMPRFKFNYFIGIRTPWTLSSEHVWTKTHQISGKLYVIGGFLLLLCSFLPIKWKVVSIIVITVIVSLLASVISYIWYKRLQKN